MSDGLVLRLPRDVVDAIVEEVTARVLSELRRDAEPAPSPYLTVPEAAAVLRCSRQRVDDLLSQRRLTRVKDGRRTLIRRAELERYLAER